MLLSPTERDRTARELETNLQESGLTLQELCEQSGLVEDRFMDAFFVTGRESIIVDIWLLHDLLEVAIAHRGGTFTPFSQLAEDNRAEEESWYLPLAHCG